MSDLLTPGIYEGITSEQYHIQPYCSNSRLSLLARSPAHLQADLQSPPAESDAMRLGTAIHMAVFEPDLFDASYTEAGQCEAALKSGKRAGERCTNNGTARWSGAWFCGQHKGSGDADDVRMITRSEFLTCLGVRASLQAHPRLSRLLAAPGRSELTVIWDDAGTGVRCKARIDRLVESFGGVVLDLKTTTDARPHAFEKKIFDFGYYRQSGLYQDALRAHGIETSHLVIAAAEREAPYAVAGYRLADGAADAGRDEVRRLMEIYARCQQEGHWPAYPDTINEISLPFYGWNQLESEAA